MCNIITTFNNRTFARLVCKETWFLVRIQLNKSKILLYQLERELYKGRLFLIPSYTLGWMLAFLSKGWFCPGEYLHLSNLNFFFFILL